MHDNLQTTGVTEMAKDDAVPGPDDLLTTAEAGEVMGVTDAHVRRVIGAGQLKAQRFGERAWMVRRADAEAWAKAERRTGPKGGIRLTLTVSDVRQARDLGEELHPNIPAHALRLANQLLDAGATGTYNAGPDCELEVEAERVTFRLPGMSAPRRTTRIDFT